MIASSGDTLQLDAPLPLEPPAHDRGAARRTISTPCSARTSRAVLERCGWRINGSGNAAERLGIHPNTLRFRMKKLGVACPRERASAQLDAGGNQPVHS